MVSRSLLLFALFTSFPLLAIGQGKSWSLDACIKQALRENILLKESIANNEINEINYLQAKANLLPNLNLSDVHTIESGRFISQPSNQYTYQHITSNTLNLSSNLTLYNGAKNHNLLKENRLYTIAGELDIAKLENDLMLNVVAAYMQVLFEHEAVNIAHTIVEVDTDHINYIRKYVNAGSLAESNLLQAQAQLSSDKAAKVSEENQLQLARVALMQLMELPISDSFEIEQPQADDVSPDVPCTADEINSIAQGFLPEVRSAETKMRASEIGLKISKADLQPKLTLSGSLSTSYSSVNRLLSYSSNTQVQSIGYLGSNTSEYVYGPVTSTVIHSSDYSFVRQFGDNLIPGISLNLSVPIFNNRIYKSNIEKSAIAVKVAKLNETAVKNQLRKNIEQAYSDQLAAAKNLSATKEQLLAEERSYHDMNIKFRAGMITATDFFVEKGNYNRALYNHLSAKYQYMFKSKIVSFYTGERITE